WWWTAPMIVGTFLEHYDLTGYDIYPFSQSASMNASQFETSMEFVRECAAGANVNNGLFARASSTTNINAYLTANGFVG
ncbi:MAG: flavodoxin, partial [Clostridia bacterium]|nr:flavodoxin [Clostridia bacterium]